jgi:uncharacterized protein
MTVQPGPGRRIGLAIFVKTPGHSALKTRLAEGIGRDAAERFHRLAAEAVAAVARAARQRSPGLEPGWAVAEEAALDDALWAGLPTIAQGPGDLGARMRRVTEALCGATGAALLIGADTPQLCVDDLVRAVEALDEHDHVIGPSQDGGFWLFGTRGAVPPAAWTATPWSRADTAARFRGALATSSVATLRSLRDVDTVADLAPLLATLDALPSPLPEQARLASWLPVHSQNL